jgi:hypothetical protein
MSTYAFNPRHQSIIIKAEITGPNGMTNVDLAPDTGASTSVIRLTNLLKLGFDPTEPLRMTRMTSGSSITTVPVFGLTRFSALGQHRFGFPVIGSPLSSAYGIDGLLGLDFLRDQVLTIDFRLGQITLA